MATNYKDQARPNFEWSQFTALTENVNPGLALHLVNQILDRKVALALHQYDNPLESRVVAIISELKEIHAQIKRESKERFERRQVSQPDGVKDNTPNAQNEAMAAMQAKIEALELAALEKETAPAKE